MIKDVGNFVDVIVEFNILADPREQGSVQNIEQVATNALLALNHSHNSSNTESLKKLKISIQQIKTNLKLSQSETPKLDQLLNKLNDLLTIKFQAKSTNSPFDQVKMPIRALFQFMTGKIVDKVNQMIYIGWAKKVKDKNLKEALEKELEARYENWAKREHSKATNQEEHDKINQVLQLERGNLPVQVVIKNPQLQKMDEIRKKGEETRTQFMEIGGKRIALQTSDGIKLDATYLSAKDFSNKIKAEGGKSIALKLSSGQNLNGILFPDRSQSALVGLLQNLNLANSNGKDGSGYRFVRVPNSNACILMKNEDLARHVDQLTQMPPGACLEDNEGMFQFQPTAIISVDEKELPSLSDKERSAAILTSGNAGVYEMHKGEALALLMRGVDVMLVNLRGYGESQGTPSVDGSYLDVEAAYQFVKKENPSMPDSKIVAWSMCLSGGIAAHLAEKHPGMNLFLNQTYADMRAIIKKEVSEAVEKWMGLQKQTVKEHNRIKAFFSSVITELVHFALSFITPNYRVNEHLKNIKGHVCTIQALSDSIMGQKETAEMAAIMREKQIPHQKIEIPGQHCTNWTQAFIPKFKIRTAKGDVEKGLSDYLAIKWGDKIYYVAKELLDRKQGCKVGSTTFKRYPKTDLHLLHVTSPKITEQGMTTTATELEITDSNAFLKSMSERIVRGNKLLVEGSFEWSYIGHIKVNKFLEEAQLGKTLI